jgi:hypothetical protein
MADVIEQLAEKQPGEGAQSGDVQLERGTYEIIRSRLSAHADELRSRLNKLNDQRREVFGSIETKLIATERITTENNCVARDIVAVGDRFIFGYNVHIGLKSETKLSDVFTVHRFREMGFHPEPLDLLNDPNFEHDFKQLYKYYKATTFAKFHVIGPHLYMVFRVGASPRDIKTFKWIVQADSLKYVDNRSDHEAVFPAQHDFRWTRTHRDLHRKGSHPHISIDDRVFVETIGGDLTVKVEDNTDDGEGIYREPVDDADQTLDDAEIFYAIVGNIILLKIRPYREEKFRYLVFNEKTSAVTRLDSIEDSCVLLPEGHGLIFSNGYYLQTGESKIFESSIRNLLFEKRISSANGEDYMYVFYNQESGEHVMLPYNMIAQKVETPIFCSGYSFFEDGHLALFKADGSPQRHHAMQLWQTPYVGESFQTTTKQDSFLYKIGNRDIVRAMSECHEIIGLIDKDDSYANLYVDLVKKANDVLDAYFWLKNDETGNLGATLAEVKSAATAAVDEFDKVVRVRRNTKEQFTATQKRTREIVSSAATRMYQKIDDFVKSLSDLRTVRGEIVSLRELKYVDLQEVEKLEQEVSDNTDRISLRCVDFLLREDSLKPYENRVQAQRDSIESIEKVAVAKKLEAEIAAGAAELEMLIDIVSNLKIDDATERTRIIDNISSIYSKLNQARALLKKQSKELMSVEGAAEFNSQLKLLSQAVVNYLDVCDTPQRCDEYLTKMMVQVEELEGRFAEFDQYIIQITEKREEIYAAFDTRKLQIVEARNKRAASLAAAAERILNGIRTRANNLKTINEINSYFASDLMIDKIRDIVEQLTDLDDSVKVDDIQSQLKTIREDAVRQLKDRQELFVGGKNVIQLGRHQFSVNVQNLDLTTVMKDDRMSFHLTGTNFMEAIRDEAFLATRDVWQQDIVSENRQVYRAEYLAYQLLKQIEAANEIEQAQWLAIDENELVARVQKFMAPRYTEGYVKGVHDHDAAKLLKALLLLKTQIGLLRYPTDARALATIFWSYAPSSQLEDSKQVRYQRKQLVAQLSGAGSVSRLFPQSSSKQKYIRLLKDQIAQFVETLPGFDATLNQQAAEYLFAELSHAQQFSISNPAAKLIEHFLEYLKRHQSEKLFNDSLKQVSEHQSQFELVHAWLSAFIEQHDPADMPFVNEAAAVILDGSFQNRSRMTGNPNREVTGLLGSHSLLEGDSYQVDFNQFVLRLEKFEQQTVPRYLQYVELKKRLLDEKRREMKLEEFKPRVLTSFVRNKLINDVYLPLIGDNLAKQIGAVGDEKRTDLMGLLLLISPPGYGKTTLMEYIANRLGITFMKINGPAIGHHVTSLDPNEAPNASAREEIEKLNLSLEMGDNVMIYLDDIQHCNPEFLQKFISLCDGQRKIEGVYKGRTRTYDLRGRKVCVVMAGNPYTESGDKFQIPDMLANRADTYNLGDVIGDSKDAFELSYLENCLTSNQSLSVLQSRSRNDIYAIIKMAQQDKPQGESLEGSYSIEQINELVGVMRKLFTVRDVLLKVNEMYIQSAAQADEYRTEPAFKLQGSYRDMNKIAERIVPIMNDAELDTLIRSHFENQAQTLTTGAEANLLKFNELMGTLVGEDLQRWNDIKRTFKRNLLLGGAAGDDKVAQIIAQMSTFSDGLAGIENVLQAGMGSFKKPPAEDAAQEATLRRISTEQISNAVAHLASFNENLAAIRDSLESGSNELARSLAEKPAGLEIIQAQPVPAQPVQAMPAQPFKVQVINKIPKTFLDVIRTQFYILQTWVEPLMQLASTTDNAKLKKAIETSNQRYQELLQKIQGDAEIEE